MQPSEYPLGGYDPIDPPLFLSLPPLLLLLLGLLILLAVLGGWYGRERMGPRAPDGTEALWKAVDKAARAALGAHADQLPARARDLREVIEARLGPVMKVGGGAGPALKALDGALKGKIKQSGDAARPGGDHGPAPVTVVNNSHVVIRDGHVEREAGHEKPPSPDPAPAPPGDRDMTEEERIDALRRAVGRFHDYWSRKDARLGELRDARRALG